MQTNRQKREKRVEQIKALGAFGASAQGSFRHAWELFTSGDSENRIKSEELATQLLSFPELGDLHKAGCHIIMAHGVEDYVEHATKALTIYKNLYTVRSGGSFSGTRFKPTNMALANQQTLIKFAQKLLTKAQKDHAAIEDDYQRQYRAFERSHGRQPTDDELVKADMTQLSDDFFEYLDDIGRSTQVLLNEPMPKEDVTRPDREDWEDMEDEIEVMPVAAMPVMPTQEAESGGDTRMDDDASSIAPAERSSPPLVMFNQPRFDMPTPAPTSSPPRRGRDEEER